jgi:hypothetical protein
LFDLQQGEEETQMANMSINQRNQFSRVELSVPTTGVRVRSRWALVAYLAVAFAILGTLGYAAVERVDGWAQAVVFGMIVVTTIGLMIAISPNRRA